jgi:hypothetical protein
LSEVSLEIRIGSRFWQFQLDALEKIDRVHIISFGLSNSSGRHTLSIERLYLSDWDSGILHLPGPGQWLKTTSR